MASPSTSIIGNCSTPHVVEDSPASNKIAEHVALLLNVIRSQRWKAFETIVFSNANVFTTILAAVPQYNNQNSSLLHTIVQHEVPLEVLIKVIRMLPKSQVHAQDCTGRTPLHVAAARGANPMILKVLAAMEPKTCTALDEDGRTPLHLACGAHIQDTTNHTAQVSIDSVRALLSESLSASLIEDQDEMSALEYAIMSDASLEVVNMLQMASVECLKEKETQQSIVAPSTSLSSKRRFDTSECHVRRVRRVSDQTM